MTFNLNGFRPRLSCSFGTTLCLHSNHHLSWVIPRLKESNIKPGANAPARTRTGMTTRVTTIQVPRVCLVSPRGLYKCRGQSFTKINSLREKKSRAGSDLVLTSVGGLGRIGKYIGQSIMCASFRVQPQKKF